MTRWLPRPSPWRRDVLRTNLWLVPTVEVIVAVLIFAVTFPIDRAAGRGHVQLPGWVDQGSPDAARQILTAIAAAMITVVGLVFSITIVALTLASTQFGPRMLRNFIRDRGTQVTLGTFVATFVYAMLALGAVGHGEHGTFVPHLSITVLLVLVLVSLCVLIYFIHHVATSIQLPEVIAAIAADLTVAIDVEASTRDGSADAPAGGNEQVAEVLRRIDDGGRDLAAPRSGYVQFVEYETLAAIATEEGAVIRLHFRAGHFLVQGLPYARVWPASAHDAIARRLGRMHVTGSQRTLAQDLAFAIDQLVEIAIRALSPAVNDTFTAMTCVDWLGDALYKLTLSWSPRRVHRDASGAVRVVTAEVPYHRFVDRSFDKIRQAARGMPAVMIRQLDALVRVLPATTTDDQRRALTDQAEMILRAADESVPEPADRADVRARFDRFVAAMPAS